MDRVAYREQTRLAEGETREGVPPRTCCCCCCCCAFVEGLVVKGTALPTLSVA